ncbi:MAG: putative toxin-antitoxin system toxin component, PIN family [Chloroflexi bacterium]|nr:putative toxin-antitoxin system toxin component, PIN family [Chloroflexota bacterium]
MAKKGRYVLDTNVVVSALLIKKSVARRALDKARKTGGILLSLEVIEELFDVLGRPAFNRYVDERDRVQFLTLLIRDGILVDINRRVAVCRDPKDDKYLDLAINGKVDIVISGDAELLTLHPFRDIRILDPRQFLEAEP